ncbi:transcriptional repressor DicA [Gemmata sp. SH-PL17]|nr:transcriptional repressor DicA [Gemmata sp. SH-PL17]
MTQEQLAALVGISYQSLARYERGAVEPTWPKVLQLAKALDVSPEAFTTAEDQPAPLEPIAETDVMHAMPATVSPVQHVDLEITINRKFDSYTEEDQRKLMEAIARLLEIDGIKVTSRKKG